MAPATFLGPASLQTLQNHRSVHSEMQFQIRQLRNRLSDETAIRNVQYRESRNSKVRRRGARCAVRDVGDGAGFRHRRRRYRSRPALFLWPPGNSFRTNVPHPAGENQFLSLPRPLSARRGGASRPSSGVTRRGDASTGLLLFTWGLTTHRRRRCMASEERDAS